MSTSLVMMDTSAHVRRSAVATSNASSASSADHHHSLHSLHHHHIDIKPQTIVTSNGSLNFMKLFSTNNNNNSNQNSANNLHLHLNNFAQLQHQHQQQQHHHQPNGIAPAAPVTVKLESRVPSPCTADLANIKSEHPSGLPGPSVKDLSLFITSKSGAPNTTTGQQQTLLTLNSNSSSTMSATALDAINGLGGAGSALSLKHRRSVAAAESETSSGGSSAAGSVFLPGQTLLPNGGGTLGAHSPSPPPLLPNGGGHFGRINGYSTPGQLGSGKRDHDDAFGPSSTTTSTTLNGGGSISTTTPTSMNVSSSMSSSNNNSLASLPSSTNSPSPPPLLTNGHGQQGHLLNSNSNSNHQQQQHHLSHQAMVNSMINAANGGAGNTNIASPTSSSFSDFGSTVLSSHWSTHSFPI
ncbi:hypothetical protein TYRP_003281 [Tyrophagus putrescentiae]|nr:hypothetical protein TYRP_003281 [Tyrophagus putrescentiae]